MRHWNGWDWLLGTFSVVLIVLIVFGWVVPSLRVEREGSVPVQCRAQCTLSGMRVHSVSPYDISTCRCAELEPQIAGTGHRARDNRDLVDSCIREMTGTLDGGDTEARCQELVGKAMRPRWDFAKERWVP